MNRILVPVLYLKDGAAYRDMDLTEKYEGDIPEAADLQERRGADALLIFDYSYDKESQEAALRDIGGICRSVDIPVWVGGNILCRKDADNYFKAGAAVVILDEERISNVDLMEELCRRYGSGRVALNHIPGGNDALGEAAANRIAFVISPDIPDMAPGGLDYLILADRMDHAKAVEILQKRNALGISGQFLTETAETFWQMKRQLKGAGIAVHTLDPAMPFTEFKLDANGLIPAIAQDTTLWGGMSASTVSFATLTPYALLGLAFGPVAGVLASKFGYHVVLRAGLVVTIVGALFGIFVANSPSIAALVVISVVLGISYAGTANIMLNGLGIVLSPKDNPGYLPGMNAGAFNLGAGLSFAVLYAVMNSFTVSGGAATGYAASLVAGAVLVGAALLCSFLIPKEEDADNS